MLLLQLLTTLLPLNKIKVFTKTFKRKEEIFPLVLLNNNFHEFLKSFYVKFLVVVVVVDGDVCSFFVLNDLQEFFTVSKFGFLER